MEQLATLEAGDFFHDLPDATVRGILSKYLGEMESGLIREADGRYSLSLAKGVVGLRFIRQEEHASEGVCELEWMEKEAEGPGIPAWEFRWKEGDMDSRSAVRLVRIIRWIGQVNERTEDPVPVCSRCFEESIGFPLLKGGRRILVVRDIVRLQADRDWTRITYGHGPQKETVLIDRSISRCEQDLLPYGFLRIHRSHLVNPGCIRRCMDSGLNNMVDLCDGSSLPVARRRCADLRARLRAIRARLDHLSESFAEPKNT